MSDGIINYRKMNGAFGRVAKTAPDNVDPLVDDLGGLIASFAPYVASAESVDDNDIQQITDLTPEFVAIDKLNRSARSGTGEVVLAVNLRGIFHSARNSFKNTNEEGDTVLSAIAVKCGEIANALL